MKSMLRDYHKSPDGLYRKTVHYDDTPSPTTLVRDADGNLVRIEEPCKTIEIAKPKTKTNKNEPFPTIQ